MNLLKPNDKVFVPSLGVNAKVLHVRDVTIPEENSIYEVQISKYFRRSDLELDDSHARVEKRKQDIASATEQWESAKQKWEQAQAGPEDQRVAAGIEWAKATDRLYRELGYPGILEPL